MDIADWLRDLGLERYEQAFRDNDIDAEVLPQLTADDLKDSGSPRSATAARSLPRSGPGVDPAPAAPATGSAQAPAAAPAPRRGSRAAAADGAVLRPGRLDRAVGAARSRGHGRGDPRLPELLSPTRSSARAATSPSSWATACSPISAGRRRMRTMPSGRSGPGSTMVEAVAGLAGRRPTARGADRHRDRAGGGRRADRRRRGAGAGGGRRDAEPRRPAAGAGRAGQRRHQPGDPAAGRRPVRADRPRPDRLKGFAEPLAAFRVEGEGRAEGRFEALHGAAPDAAGRPRARARHAAGALGLGQGRRRPGGPDLGRAGHRQVASARGAARAAGRRAARRAQPLLLALPHQQRAPSGHRAAGAGGGLCRR